MKKVIIIAAALFSLGILGYQKLTAARTVLGHLRFRIKRIKNMRFEGNHLVFDVIVELTNPTDIPFDINTGSLIALKRIDYYDPFGNTLAVSDINLSKISLPANSSIELPPIATTVSLFKGIEQIIKTPSDIRAVATIEGFGQQYKIEQ